MFKKYHNRISNRTEQSIMNKFFVFFIPDKCRDRILEQTEASSYESFSIHHTYVISFDACNTAVDIASLQNIRMSRYKIQCSQHDTEVYFRNKY
jgi:hypothetical protein